MTLKAFFFLFVVTIVAVVAGAYIAEQLVAPGFGRGVVIAIIAGAVVFPAARWAEYRGWIQGDWSPGKPLRKAADRAEAAERARADGRTDTPAPPPSGDPR